MSMAKIFLKAAKAILVGMVATAVGYAGYKTVAEAKRKASGAVRETPENTVFKFEGEIINTDTHESRTVGCEAKDDTAAYARFMDMCEDDEHVGTYDVTDFPYGYAEQEMAGESKFHYGTVEEYKALQEPLTKKERRTVFFKQLGISAKDWFLNEDLIDSLMFSAMGLAALRLGELCGRGMVKDGVKDAIEKSASEYGMKDTDSPAIKFAGWVNDCIIENGGVKAGEAIAFGMTTDGCHFVTPTSPVNKDEDGRHSIAWKLTI